MYASCVKISIVRDRSRYLTKLSAELDRDLHSLEDSCHKVNDTHGLMSVTCLCLPQQTNQLSNELSRPSINQPISQAYCAVGVSLTRSLSLWNSRTQQATTKQTNKQTTQSPQSPNHTHATSEVSRTESSGFSLSGLSHTHARALASSCACQRCTTTECLPACLPACQREIWASRATPPL